MAQRGHVILKTKNDDGSFRWVMYYLAYNAIPSYVLPILEKYPDDCKIQIASCRTGIASFWDEEKSTRYVGEYHDYRDLDVHKHPNTDYPTLEAALLACRHPNIYIWDGVWSHQEISAEAKAIANPPRVKRNVWRERRKSHESKPEEVKPVEIENTISE